VMVSFSIYPTPTGAADQTGSAGNVIAALASFFAPGLGQLIQGRFGSALVLFLGTSIGYFLWFLILPGLFALALHLVAILDAATYTPGRDAAPHGEDGFASGHRVHFAE
jgi:TM2 domain-containing membrane protein YozV